MLRNLVLIFLFAIFSISAIQAQRIFYSEPDRNDQKSLNFDIVGKINDHYLIFKSYRSSNYVSVYDTEMKLVENVTLDFIPDKTLGTDLLAYKDHFYLFYQYQRRNIAYMMAAKIDGNGKIVGEPMELDTTTVNSYSNNRIYNVINSEDKQKIMLFKINSKNNDRYALTSVLLNSDLNKLGRSRVYVDMPERSDFLSEFTLGNDATMLFLRAAGSSDNDNLTKLTLLSKRATEDSVYSYDLEIKDMYLDDVKIKADNVNSRYLITSFYSKTKRGNIDGLFCAIWNKSDHSILYSSNTTFSEEIRNSAKSEGNPKYAFNDFYIQNILVKRDGGFVIASESLYSSSRGSNYNRWDYLYGSPFMRPYNYFYSSPFYGGYYYPWSRFGNNGFQVNRYYADNIAIISFDSSANMQWTNVIHKSQYDDYTDNFLGYGTLNTGGKFHFLFNQLEKRTQLLTDQSLTPDGEINRSPTLRNLSKEYQFMPKFAKQVSGYELLVPCQYRNYICFAKVEY